VHVDRLPRDVAGIVAREERHQAGDIGAGAGACHRDVAHPFGHQLAGLVIAQQLAPGLVVAGTDGATHRLEQDTMKIDITSPAVRLTDLHKRYGDFAAVDGVSLDVRKSS